MKDLKNDILPLFAGNEKLPVACRELLSYLGLGEGSQRHSDNPIADLEELYKKQFGTPDKALEELFSRIDSSYYVAKLNKQLFEKREEESLDDTLESLRAESERKEAETDSPADEKADSDAATEKPKYDALMIFAVDIKGEKPLTRTEQAVLTRAFNRISYKFPVILIIREGNKLSIANCERTNYLRKEGERVGRVAILRGIECLHPHRGHLDIIEGMKLTGAERNFDALYTKWMQQFNISTLNTNFYKELQEWFYWADSEIVLPKNEETLQEPELVKRNFLVRTLSRMMFCWFLKERNLIDETVLCLKDYQGTRYPIVDDINSDEFLSSNSYYRGILQNVFFNGLNSDTKKTAKDFKWRGYLPAKFDYRIFTELPFLNGSIFRPLNEDFAKESIEDSVMKVPNRLFYGDEKHKGINAIFCDYKFTVEENTPRDVDIALDPEMLGMVFENLLAEIDPQNDKETAKSIRKATGSFYTPRPVIQEMVNECLLQYLQKQLLKDGGSKKEINDFLVQLIHHERLTTEEYNRSLVRALYHIRMLDPACGSGAFPMGMLQRIVDILRIIDPGSKTWLQMMLEPIVDKDVRENFEKQLSGNTSDYSRKLGIIRNCIYGIDIQPIAVQITKLRFFISLLADQKIDPTKPNRGIMPFPNLETKIICADSLKSLSRDMFVDKTKADLIEARRNYYRPNITEAEREKIADDIATLMDTTFPTFYMQLGLKQVSNKAVLKRWFLDASVNAPFFDAKIFFPEVENDFDIVMGNPPYGGFRIEDTVRDSLKLGSNDPYGAFIARFLGTASVSSPLKVGGILAFIVSDTFTTIRTHKELRKLIMRHRIEKMIRMSPKTFGATVNTLIMICEKCRLEKQDTEEQDNICTMADMTNIDIHEDYERFVDLLTQSMGGKQSVATPEYAIYHYPQSLIRRNSNLPFFVASPKLFTLLADDGKIGKKNFVLPDGTKTQYRTCTLNKKTIDFFRLGDIAETYQGLATADNDAYLFQERSARGSYRDIAVQTDKILTAADLHKITSDEQLRMAVIENGISKDDATSERYFGGRYIIRYDKGGESDTESGWLPNYNLPSQYYIDWSEWAVNRMRTLTIAERNAIKGKTTNAANANKICSRFQNSQTYFKPFIAYSRVGMYAPTFRVGTIGPYDCGACAISNNLYTVNYIIACCASKLGRYLVRTMVNHTVQFGVENVKDMLIPKVDENDANLKRIEELVESICKKQAQDRRYPYAKNEQIEIDKIVYDLFGLDDEDIEEVENWYKRCYPKLR